MGSSFGEMYISDSKEEVKFMLRVSELGNILE